MDEKINPNSIRIVALQEGVWKVKYEVPRPCCGGSVKKSKIIYQTEKPKLDEIRNKWNEL